MSDAYDHDCDCHLCVPPLEESPKRSAEMSIKVEQYTGPWGDACLRVIEADDMHPDCTAEVCLTLSEARQLRDELTRVLMEADPEASKPLPWPSLNPPRSKP